MITREKIAKIIKEYKEKKSIFLIDPDGHWEDFEHSSNVVYCKEKEEISNILFVLKGESLHRAKIKTGENRREWWVLIIDSPTMISQDEELSKRLLAIEKNAGAAGIEIIEYDPRPNRFRDDFVKAGLLD